LIFIKNLQSGYQVNSKDSKNELKKLTKLITEISAISEQSTFKVKDANLRTKKCVQRYDHLKIQLARFNNEQRGPHK
jgi:hypothetical protein